VGAWGVASREVTVVQLRQLPVEGGGHHNGGRL
jgi:hypothetical protein